MRGKKGDIEWNESLPWIIAFVVILLFIALAYIFRDSIFSAISRFNELISGSG